MAAKKFHALPRRRQIDKLMIVKTRTKSSKKKERKAEEGRKKWKAKRQACKAAAKAATLFGLGLRGRPIYEKSIYMILYLKQFLQRFDSVCKMWKDFTQSEEKECHIQISLVAWNNSSFQMLYELL